ncbi:MAG TPA: DUF58 domain-containing protein [Candidatus Aquilonibacter sp.]|nr:DUF58 domain-containing protein [Candidatus Aquilonibacter sp.]
MAHSSLRDALLRGKRRPRRFGAGSPTTYRGDGYEFVELRTYVPGDDVRRIDWAATARAGELQTRVVLEDVALTLASFVDDSPSMRVGRKRMLLDAALEVQDAWYGASQSGDRLLRITSGNVTHPAAATQDPFELAAVLAVANAALPRGAALLGVSDWLDLEPECEEMMVRLAQRCDCTALIARDPWYERLPLHGFVRLRGAEGGHARIWIGRPERERFARAVRERERTLQTRLAALGWRTAVFEEHDGAAALHDAFA